MCSGSHGAYLPCIDVNSTAAGRIAPLGHRDMCCFPLLDVFFFTLTLHRTLNVPFLETSPWSRTIKTYLPDTLLVFCSRGLVQHLYTASTAVKQTQFIILFCRPPCLRRKSDTVPSYRISKKKPTHCENPVQRGARFKRGVCQDISTSLSSAILLEPISLLTM